MGLELIQEVMLKLGSQLFVVRCQASDRLPWGWWQDVLLDTVEHSFLGTHFAPTLKLYVGVAQHVSCGGTTTIVESTERCKLLLNLYGYPLFYRSLVLPNADEHHRDRKSVV